MPEAAAQVAPHARPVRQRGAAGRRSCCCQAATRRSQRGVKPRPCSLAPLLSHQLQPLPPPRPPALLMFVAARRAGGWWRARAGVAGWWEWVLLARVYEGAGGRNRCVLRQRACEKEGGTQDASSVCSSGQAGSGAPRGGGPGRRLLSCACGLAAGARFMPVAGRACGQTFEKQAACPRSGTRSSSRARAATGS